MEMNQTSIVNRKYLPTSKYIIAHIIKPTSKMCDYDYDPDHPDRRFFSGFIHTLEFKDPIMDTLVLSITFSSIELMEIVDGLYNISGGVTLDKSKQICCAKTIQNIYIDGNPTPGMILEYALDGNAYINVFSSAHDCTSFNFGLEELISLINLLDIDELADLYVSYSSDRDQEKGVL